MPESSPVPGTDPAAALLVDGRGQRLMRVGEDFFAGLREGLEDEIGASASDVLYKCGLRWGRDSIRELRTKMGIEGVATAEALDMPKLLEVWRVPLSAAGWGRWKFDFTHGGKGLVLVELLDSVTAQTKGEATAPACHAYAGLFTGLLSSLSKKELFGIEVHCRAMGQKSCLIAVGGEARITAAAQRRAEGATPREILSLLLTQALQER